MAWRSSGTSNSELVENMWRNKLITKEVVKEAFLKVDRAHYAPRAPYEDSPQGIGHNATISAPHMHAAAVEQLLPFLQPSGSSSASIAANANGGPRRRRRRRVLDIGSGSGYLTHVLAELVGDQGKVVGVEHIAALKELGEGNMTKSEEGRRLLETGRVKFRVGDGRRGWIEPNEPDAALSGDEESSNMGDRHVDQGWDAIHVGASAVEVHQELLDQLRSPGRLFIPVDDDDGGFEQHVWTIDKDAEGHVTRRKLFGVRYVPLTDAPR